MGFIFYLRFNKCFFCFFENEKINIDILIYMYNKKNCEKGDFCILEIEDIVYICNMKIYVFYI